MSRLPEGTWADRFLLEETIMTLDSMLTARAYDLSQPLESTLPVRPANLPYKMSMVYRHGDHVGEGGTSAALEAITMSSHSGTHIDALSHISCEGKLFGDESAADAQRGGRLKAHGVETIAPLIYPAVLLDVARILGVDRLEPAQAVTRDDLEKARAAQATTIPANGAVLIRTGWGDRDFYRSQDYLGSRAVLARMCPQPIGSSSTARSSPALTPCSTRLSTRQPPRSPSISV